MIKVLKYGEVPMSEVFARVTPTVNVEAIVAEILADVKQNGDAALYAYCEKFDKVKLSSLSVSEQEIEDENWNSAWEQESFNPVDVDGKLLIRAPHHTPPSEGIIDIIVAPQMSFGSGHHQTTRMMCRLIENLRIKGRMLDVGCGTGVLSIAALKCGATSADAIDIDPWSTESAKYAAELNGLNNKMNIILGTVEAIEGEQYDMVVANINRNIILNDIDRYFNALKSGGTLLLSGFLHQDIEDITTGGTSRGLTHTTTLEEDEWVAMAFTK
jgi:ribosomal protein L11 methyltransferase